MLMYLLQFQYNKQLFIDVASALNLMAKFYQFLASFKYRMGS